MDGSEDIVIRWDFDPTHDVHWRKCQFAHVEALMSKVTELYQNCEITYIIDLGEDGIGVGSCRDGKTVYYHEDLHICSAIDGDDWLFVDQFGPNTTINIEVIHTTLVNNLDDDLLMQLSASFTIKLVASEIDSIQFTVSPESISRVRDHEEAFCRPPCESRFLTGVTFSETMRGVPPEVLSQYVNGCLADLDYFMRYPQN
jgi:hypothetical protein